MHDDVPTHRGTNPLCVGTSSSLPVWVFLAIYLMYSSFKKNAILLCIILINLYLCNRENNLSMSKEQSNIVEYLVCVIGAFAKQFSLTNAKAYQYLRQYKGLDFLTKHYDIEHTQSIEDAVEDITIVCNRHGGALVL